MTTPSTARDPSALLAAARDAGILLWREGERIRWRTTKAPAPAELLEALRRVKPALRPLLPEGIPADPMAAGRDRLEALAAELRHPLADLLEWYAHDLDDLGTLSADAARRVVTDYLENRDTYRRMAGLRVERPKAEAAPAPPAEVFCCQCARWTPDPVNPGAGLGTCEAGASVLAWPHLPRRCESFTPSAGAE